MKTNAMNLNALLNAREEAQNLQSQISSLKCHLTACCAMMSDEQFEMSLSQIEYLTVRLNQALALIQYYEKQLGR